MNDWSCEATLAVVVDRSSLTKPGPFVRPTHVVVVNKMSAQRRRRLTVWRGDIITSITDVDAIVRQQTLLITTKGWTGGRMFVPTGTLVFGPK
jgi:hypothetical protein